MKAHRIFAIIYRYLLLLKRSYYRLSDIFLWPMIELILWGVTSYFISSVAPDFPQIVLFIISGVFLWLVVERAQGDISVSLLEEIWSKNLINVFVSPIRLFEWLIGLIAYGLIKLTLAMTFASFVAYVLYQFKIFIFGIYLVPFLGLLLMTSWWIGLIVSSFIFRFGNKAGIIAWSSVALISPFSAIYYPVSILPVWAQHISAAIPTSYVFEGMREIIATGRIDPEKLIMSFVLNTVYLIVAFVIFKISFQKMLKRGLVKVY